MIAMKFGRIKALGVVATGVVLSLLGVGPAYAEGVAYGINAYGYTDYPYIVACDTAVDGNRVRAHVIINGLIIKGPWAPSQGCNVSVYPSYTSYFRVCTENLGCSDWVQVLFSS